VYSSGPHGDKEYESPRSNKTAPAKKESFLEGTLLFDCLETVNIVDLIVHKEVYKHRLVACEKKYKGIMRVHSNLFSEIDVANLKSV
jgi:hypothetical protein